MANRYLIKLWILTLLLGPFTYAVYDIVFGVEGAVITLLEVLPLTLVLSFLFSLPTLAIAFLANKIMSTYSISEWNGRLFIISIAAIGLVCTLLIIQGSLMPVLLKSYLISLALAGIILELFIKTKRN